MLTVVASNDNSGTISIPVNELEKLGLKDGDEVEISKNENDELILRSKQSRTSRRKFSKRPRNYRRTKISFDRTRKRSRMSELFFPDFEEVLLIHAEIIKSTGGSEGLRDAGGLESA